MKERIISALLLAACALIVTSAVLRERARASAASQSRGETLVKNSDCLSCHAIDRKVVGPAYTSVAQRYSGQTNAVAKLVAKVRTGGSGNWGSVAMSPHPNISTADLTSMVQWILTLRASPKTPRSTGAKTYTYNLNGKRVTLDFPVFVRDHVVTSAIFNGWQLFDAYCFRCHGPDAVGGELAPDLRQSLAQGMTRDQFVSTAMTGRVSKGMPSWAGFFTVGQITNIYEYTKSRSVGLVPASRPAGQ